VAAGVGKLFEQSLESLTRKEKEMRECKPYFIVVKFVKKGNFKIWKDYDEGHIWGSPVYEVVDYFNSYKDAQNCVKTCKA